MAVFLLIYKVSAKNKAFKNYSSNKWLFLMDERQKNSDKNYCYA